MKQKEPMLFPGLIFSKVQLFEAAAQSLRFCPLLFASLFDCCKLILSRGVDGRGGENPCCSAQQLWSAFPRSTSINFI